LALTYIARLVVGGVGAAIRVLTLTAARSRVPTSTSRGLDREAGGPRGLRINNPRHTRELRSRGGPRPPIIGKLLGHAGEHDQRCAHRDTDPLRRASEHIRRPACRGDGRGPNAMKKLDTTSRTVAVI